MKPFFLSRFPSSVMLFGRKLPKLAENGDSKRILHILEKGAFGVEKYNESYLSFAECQHRREGLEILIAAHEKFPTDTVSILGTNQSALKSANRSSCSFSHIFSLKHSLSINFRLVVKMYRATKYNGQKKTLNEERARIMATMVYTILFSDIENIDISSSRLCHRKLTIC